MDIQNYDQPIQALDYLRSKFTPLQNTKEKEESALNSFNRLQLYLRQNGEDSLIYSGWFASIIVYSLLHPEKGRDSISHDLRLTQNRVRQAFRPRKGLQKAQILLNNQSSREKTASQLGARIIVKDNGVELTRLEQIQSLYKEIFPFNHIGNPDLHPKNARYFNTSITNFFQPTSDSNHGDTQLSIQNLKFQLCMQCDRTFYDGEYTLLSLHTFLLNLGQLYQASERFEINYSRAQDYSQTLSRISGYSSKEDTSKKRYIKDFFEKNQYEIFYYTNQWNPISLEEAKEIIMPFIIANDKVVQEQNTFLEKFSLNLINENTSIIEGEYHAAMAVAALCSMLSPSVNYSALARVVHIRPDVAGTIILNTKRWIKQFEPAHVHNCMQMHYEEKPLSLEQATEVLYQQVPGLKAVLQPDLLSTAQSHYENTLPTKQIEFLNKIEVSVENKIYKEEKPHITNREDSDIDMSDVSDTQSIEEHDELALLWKAYIRGECDAGPLLSMVNHMQSPYDQDDIPSKELSDYWAVLH